MSGTSQESVIFLTFFSQSRNARNVTTRENVRVAMPAEVHCQMCRVKFHLKFEVADGKHLVNSLGKTFFDLPGKESTKKFGTKFGENFGNFVSNFATFIGNFVQQKGGAKKMSESVRSPFSKCGSSDELEKPHKYSTWGSSVKKNPNGLGPLLSLCCHAGIDASLAKVQIASMGAPIV